MKSYRLNTMEIFNRFRIWADKQGYKPWQCQYNYDHPEGFYTWYLNPGKDDIETVTHSKDVQKAILKWE